MTLNGRSFISASAVRTEPARPNRTPDARVPYIVGGSESQGEPVSRVRAGLQAPESSPFLDRIVVRSRSRILFLDVSEVTWLEAHGNYVRFHTPAEVYTVRGTLTSFEKELDPARFARIHRSVIVNREVIRELHSRRTGDFTLITQGGDQLTLSRNFRRMVPELRRRIAS